MVKFEVVRQVAEEFRQRYQVIDVDGVRVRFPEGWGLIRASNTQPALVLRAEAKTEEALGEIKRAVGAALARFPQVSSPMW
jgi:phosphomannomutase/phosphoglucomutase